ncbi:hypothetical protein LCGC14_2409950, partial [marine sediment metagenome]
TSLRAGDGFEPSATASTGSEDIDAGDVIYKRTPPMMSNLIKGWIRKKQFN